MHVPGVPKHHNVCSRCYWFTESYNSQCVSHFAERFIGTRTNTSIATCIYVVLDRKLITSMRTFSHSSGSLTAYQVHITAVGEG